MPPRIAFVLCLLFIGITFFAISKQRKTAEQPTLITEKQSETTILRGFPSWDSTSIDSIERGLKQLRAAGYPQSILDAFVRACVKEKNIARHKKLLEQYSDPPYWSADAIASLHPDFITGMRALAREELAQANEIFESVGIKKTDRELDPSMRRSFEAIPTSRIPVVKAIRFDYAQMRAQVIAETAGLVLESDLEKLRFLDQSERSELSQVLSKRELEEYEIRASATASSLRLRLAAFQPNEDEFRSLFRVQRDVEQALGVPSPYNVEQIKHFNERRDEMIREVLLPSRYIDYSVATNAALQPLNQLAARFKLGPDTIRKVIEIRKQSVDFESKVLASNSLPMKERERLVSDHVSNVNKQLATLLGPSAFAAYSEIHRGKLVTFKGTPPQK